MKYLKTYESSLDSITFDSIKEELTGLVNWELIQDAEDASLDYIDIGDTLYIYVSYGLRYFYSIEFNHSVNKNEWRRAIANWMVFNTTDKLKSDMISYVINLSKSSKHDIDYRNGDELRNLLSEMYPDEKIKAS